MFFAFRSEIKLSIFKKLWAYQLIPADMLTYYNIFHLAPPGEVTKIIFYLVDVLDVI